MFFWYGLPFALGYQQGGMAFWSGNGFERSIHNIENAPFRTKFEVDRLK